MSKRQTNEGKSKFYMFKFDLFKHIKLSPFGFAFILQILSFWSAWRWLGLRVWTSPDERWSFFALLAAIFFAFIWTKADANAERQTISTSPVRFVSVGFLTSISLTFLYAVIFAFGAPPFPRAILATAALTFTLSSWRFGKTFHAGFWSLLLLALPSVASMQFFLGYPLRVLVGKAAVFLLRMQGLDVWREGVCLHFGEKLVWIDAPCSGVKMLWFGLFLAAFLACFHRLSNLKSAAVFASAFFVILLGNIFRAAALFYIEAEIVRAPPFMHEAVGVFSFAFTGVGIIFISESLRKAKNYSRANYFPELSVLHIAKRGAAKTFIIFFLMSCSWAFFAPFWFSKKESADFAAQNSHDFSAVFPATFENLPLRQLPLSEREKFFLEDFPGSIGRFTDGRREIIVRIVGQATRKLHPASDCFRAIGYQTTPQPLKIDGEGKRWSCFSAAKASEKLRVCERIYDDAGNDWTDVSAWYWAAMNEEKGEWRAITVAERE